jgi:hypothetical protein
MATSNMKIFSWCFPIQTLVFGRMCVEPVVCYGLGLSELMTSENVLLVMLCIDR